MGNVYVINRNDGVDGREKLIHVDHYNGEEYVFPPGERVLVPVDAAVHMFGMGLEDQSDTLTRLGWNMKYDPATKLISDDPAGVKRLANFVFEEAVFTPKGALARAIEHVELA
jgi:hypothetical protein